MSEILPEADIDSVIERLLEGTNQVILTFLQYVVLDLESKFSLLKWKFVIYALNLEKYL